MDKPLAGHPNADRVVFAREAPVDEKVLPADSSHPPWQILIVDDEEDVHKITRIALKNFVFDQRPIELLSALTENDARKTLQSNPDIALILLDVVMEKDNTGLELVEYIRKELNNRIVRIVLRTGQPGKAPEHEVISSYDINDYKTKPELTAQKLYTCVISCLRAYQNLRTIEKSKAGLEQIIESTAAIFQNQTIQKFASGALSRLMGILALSPDRGVNGVYAVGLPGSPAVIMAGAGKYQPCVDQLLADTLPDEVVAFYDAYKTIGQDRIFKDSYIGVFTTKEGFSSLLYLANLSGLSSMDKRLIRMYASTISIGFDNLSLSREIVNTQKEVILTLGEVVETRSKETANHVARVAEVCYLLAVKYGLDEDEADMLRLAAPMHDVGKIGIPEVILNKPGRLTRAEFEIVKQHARIGYEILRNSKRQIMETAAIVALQHHERWDGGGYPQGLAGEQIHIYGRISAIADVFDALTHKRCYKDAWPDNRVIDFFKQEAGAHFDPDLTRIFLSSREDFFQIKARFPE